MSASTVYAVTSKGSDDIGDIFYGTSEQFDDCFGGCYVKSVEELQHVSNSIFAPDEVVVTIVE